MRAGPFRYLTRPMDAPASPATPAAPPAASRRRALRLALLLGLTSVLLGAGAVVSVLRRAPLEDFGTLPAFRFTRQDGRAFGSQELAGRPYVANFIFTRCPTVCPTFTRKMRDVQEGTQGAPVQLVSFSVDPTYDTPERLQAYAEKFRADGTRWSFLTGDYAVLKDTVMSGFKQLMVRNDQDPDDVVSIMHGEHFVLVDARGHIRGFYRSSEPDAVERVVADARRLARE